MGDMPSNTVAPAAQGDDAVTARTSSYRDATVPGESPGPVADGMADPPASGPVPIVRKDQTVTYVESLNGVDGADVGAKIATLTSQQTVFVFSKSHCPFCIEVKKTFATLNVPITVMEVNKSVDGAAVHKSLKETTKHMTLPNVFIKGQHIGGCDDVKALQARGELDELIADLIVRDPTEERKSRGEAIQPLFWFPNTVNNNVVRLVGVQVFFCCIIGIIFRDDEWIHWFATGLMLDYVARLILGSFASPIGMIATLLSSPFTPVIKPGPPKQFAAFCGVCFTLPAMALFHNGNNIAASVFLGLLMGAAGLEGFGNFCLGCVFFGWGIQFGIIPPAVYRIYANTRESVVAQWEWANVEAAKSEPPKELVHAGNQSRADLKYKRVKTDEHIVSDFHLIRNMQVGYFGMPLAIVGLATAFKLASPWLNDWVELTTGTQNPNLVQSYNLQDDVWRTLATMGAVVYMLMLALYIVRLLAYHKKCVKEWHCPMRSPSFGTITITCTLLGFLSYDQFHSPDFGRALVWMGSVTHVLLTIAKFGEWIGKSYELEHVHPSWLILPVGGFVSSLVIPIVPALVENEEPRVLAFGSNQNVEFSNFFFSFAFFMWIVIFTISFFKVVTGHNSDDRLRSQVFIWIAPPAVAAMAEFVTCFTRLTIAPGPCVNNFSQLYWISIVLLLSLLWAGMPYINFFFRNKFHMSYWTYCFSLDVVAAASSVFYSLTAYKVAEILFIATLAMACTANFLALMHTLVALIRRRGVFTPEIKWGPLSFMKLVHEGARGAMPKLTRCLNAMDTTSDARVADFIVEFDKFAILHHEHAEHEDSVVFREFERYFPDHARQWLDDHEQDRIFLADIRKKLVDLQAFTAGADGAVGEEDAKAIVSELQSKIPPFLEHFHEHLAGEEANLNPIGRKHIPLAVQKQLVKRLWEVTPAKAWAVIIPYVLENLPFIPQRKRFVKALLWGLGSERAQMLGTIIYNNCDAVMWEVLTEDIKEIIPRGVRGWRRYY